MLSTNECSVRAEGQKQTAHALSRDLSVEVRETTTYLKTRPRFAYSLYNFYEAMINDLGYRYRRIFSLLATFSRKFSKSENGPKVTLASVKNSGSVVQA